MDYDYSAPPPSYDSITSPQQHPLAYQAQGSSSQGPYPTSSSSSSTTTTTTASYIAATTISTSSASSASLSPSGYLNEKAEVRRNQEPERDIQECIQTLEGIAADAGRASKSTPVSPLAANSILSSLGYEASEGSWYEVVQQFEHVVGICYDYHVLGYGTLSITEPGLVWEGNLIQPKHSFGDFLEQDLKTFRFRFPQAEGTRSLGGNASGGGSGGHAHSNFASSTSSFSSPYSTTSTMSLLDGSSLSTMSSSILGGTDSSSLFSSSTSVLGNILKPARARRVQAATIKKVMPVVTSGAVAMARADKAFKSRLEWGGGGVLDDSEYDYPGVMLITTVLEDALSNDPDTVASFQFVFERAKLADLEKAAKDIRERLPSSLGTATSGATVSSAPSAPPLPSYEEIHGSVRSSKLSASISTPTLASKGPEKCQLCLERTADRSIIPCGHRLCVTCGQILLQARQRCPWDRLDIHSLGY